MSTASSQVEIRQRPVSWRFPRSEYGETLSFYDDYHEEVILINSECVYKSHRQSSKLNRFNMKIPNHTAIRSAKFSPQNKYIGLQINEHEVVRFSVLCGDNKSLSMLLISSLSLR